MDHDIDLENVETVICEQLYSGFTKVLLDASHRNLAKFGNKRVRKNSKILEIGVGNGEHFRYVKSNFSEYVMIDISDWGFKQIKNIIRKDTRVSFSLQSIERLDFPDNNFDRLICSCVLMHVDQPYKALTEMYRVTKPGGVISFYLACDPGLLLRIIRCLLIAPKMRNLEVHYPLIIALMHRNSVGGIVEMSKYIFKNSQIKFNYFPFHLRSWNLSTHIIVNVVKGGGN